MPQHAAERLVPYTPQEMFAVVADIAAYPQFVPYCSGIHIQSRENDMQGRETRLATMTVRYGIFEERFTSRVVLDTARLIVDTALVSGPFSKLNNNWRFEPEGEGTRVHFFLEYEFKSRLLAATLGSVFHRMFQNFEQAFEERAENLIAK